MKNGVIRVCVAAVIGLVLGASLAAPLLADDFYKGKRIRLLIGQNPGTSYDISARLVGRHIVRHIPGNPGLITQNMPGATGLIAANFVFNIAPKDGTVLAAAHQSLPMRQILGDKNVKYDAGKMQWIGSPQTSVALITVWKNSPVKTMAQAKARSIVLGATTTRASASIVTALSNHLIGTKFKLALGYKGSGIDLAMERGEVVGRAGQSWAGWNSTHPDWIRDKKVLVVSQLGLKKDPALPHVPLMTELAKDTLSKRIMNLFAAQVTMGRPMYVVPEVPKGRVAILRKAFDATMKDAKFLADARRRHHEVSPTSGAEIDGIVASIMSAPKELIAEAKKAMAYGSDYSRCEQLSDRKICRKKKKRKGKKKKKG